MSHPLSTRKPSQSLIPSSLGGYTSSSSKLMLNPQTGLPFPDTVSSQEEIKKKSLLGSMINEDPDKQFDNFTKLLLASLKNQSLDNSSNPQEMTAQIMSFLQTAEMSKSNILLGQMNEGQQEELIFKAKSFVGREVEFKSDTLYFKGAPESIAFTIPSGIKEAQLFITDERGQVMSTFNLSPEAGDQKIQWEGKTEEGTMAPEGNYRITLVAKDGLDNARPLSTRLTGFITGYTPLQGGKIEYYIGDRTLSFNDIEKIGLDQREEIARQHSQNLQFQLKELQDIKAQLESFHNR